MLIKRHDILFILLTAKPYTKVAVKKLNQFNRENNYVCECVCVCVCVCVLECVSVSIFLLLVYLDTLGLSDM